MQNRQHSGIPACFPLVVQRLMTTFSETLLLLAETNETRSVEVRKIPRFILLARRKVTEKLLRCRLNRRGGCLRLIPRERIKNTLGACKETAVLRDVNHPKIRQGAQQPAVLAEVGRKSIRGL